MKKDCWTILGIPRTNDKSVIKKAFRDLIKKYHPDMVQAPEKIRKYTIKCAEIIHAYNEAIEYSETYHVEPEITIVQENTIQVKSAPSKQKPSVFARVFCAFILVLIIIPAIFFAIELLNIYPAFSKSMKYVFTWYDSMPPESPLKMIISFPLAFILGALINGLLSSFTAIYIIFFLDALDGTKYEKYSYKICFFIIAGLNILIIYLVPFHWPFENRANGYYNFLYHLCRFLSWSCGPIYMLWEWVIDNLKYLRVKNSFRLGDLILYEKENA